jgi:hypothetical protein
VPTAKCPRLPEGMKTTSGSRAVMDAFLGGLGGLSSGR